MNEEQVRKIVREEVRAAFEEAHEDADRKTGYGSGELESSAAHVVLSAMGAAMASLEERSAPEQANPFAPKYTAQQWADSIRTMIQEAKNDGYDVWVDVEDYFGPGPFLRISPSEKDSGWENDPIIWGER